MAIKLLRRRFNVEEYHRMAQARILSEDDRVELIEGEIVEMAPIGSRHAACVKRLIQFLLLRLSGRAIVGAQDPIHLSESSEPQPDVILLRPRTDFYASSHPEAQDILLVVEVADTSVDYDREVKTPLYSRYGIPEVWLADLEGDNIEVYRDPSTEGYRTVQIFQRGRTLSPQAFPDLELPVDNILI